VRRPHHGRKCQSASDDRAIAEIRMVLNSPDSDQTIWSESAATEVSSSSIFES